LIDFRRPAKGFANVLDVWLACHDRLERVLALTERLARHVTDHGANESARVTAAEVLRYFDEAVPRHQADEDDDLFPLVLARARAARSNGEVDQAAQMIDRLGREHRTCDELWCDLREVLLHIKTRSTRAVDVPLVDQFIQSHRAHHVAEDQIICPLAQRVLMPGDLAALGETIARRRGLAWSELAAQ
jgi:hemerythrin-like domain-containing protein